jgi:hypothetical protein
MTNIENIIDLSVERDTRRERIIENWNKIQRWMAGIGILKGI